MRENIDKVEELHKVFTLPVRKIPSTIPKKEYSFRYELIKEELEEYLESCNNNNIIGISDALGDILYALYGTVVQHGLQDKIKEIFDEIHASNMSKLGENGKPLLRKDGKIIKGSHYFKPNIDKIIKNDHGY